MPQKPAQLKVGKMYEFRMLTKTGGLMTQANQDKGKGEKLRFVARVVKEYPAFYLMDAGNYRETVHKYAVGRDYRAREM